MKKRTPKVTKTARRTHAGWLLSEAAIAMLLLAAIAAGLATVLKGAARVNHYCLVKQQCIAAAEAQLDSIAATGKAISQDDVKRLWPKIRVRLDQAAGKGQWQGLRLIEATAVGQTKRGKTVSVKMLRYVHPKEEPR